MVIFTPQMWKHWIVILFYIKGKRRIVQGLVHLHNPGRRVCTCDSAHSAGAHLLQSSAMAVCCQSLVHNCRTSETPAVQQHSQTQEM